MGGSVRKRWLGIFALCVLSCFGGSASAGRAEGPSGEPPDDYVIVQFQGGVSAQALTASGKGPSLAEQGYRTVAVPKGKTRDQFLAELQARPDVISAEADGIVTAAEIPNDPFYLQNQAQYLAQIGLPAAWDLATGSNQIIVAVLDSGNDLGHPDFSGRLWENPNDAFSDGIDHDKNGCINDRYGCRFVELTVKNKAACGYSEGLPTGTTPNGFVKDDSGSALRPGAHGTFVSGIIGAAGNNGAGVTGVAWTVRLMTVKVLDCGSQNGLPTGKISNVADGIDYARLNGANIINLSLSSKDQADNSKKLRDAIQQAQDAGIIIVVAAGNYGGDPSQPGPGYPGAYTEFPSVVTVGAADQNNGMAWATFSAYGPALDFAAPGAKGIASTLRSDLGLSTLYGLDQNGGTSYATPLVSGMFALMMSRNSRLSAADYIQIARDTATPAPPASHGQNWAGAGIINIGAAVARVPMSIGGSALRDWKDVPAGTEVRATIDGTECGITATVAFGVVSRYSLRIKSAAEQPGCGVPGKVVQLWVGGAQAQPSVTWGGKNEDLGVINRDVSSVSPPPGAVVVQTLNGGWSNVAHFDAPGNLPTAFASLPTPWTAAYRWDPAKPALDGTAGAYQGFMRNTPTYVGDWASVQTYDTYWVDAPATNIANLNPNPLPGRVLQLKPGWNNFVYTGSSKAIAEALQEVTGKYTEVVQYDNANRAWLVHIPGQPRYLEDFGGLFKLKVYWVYMTKAGSITMN
jgi:hypothetical protein